MNGWFCSTYNLYNDILTAHCNYCNELRPLGLEPLSLQVAAKRTGWFNRDIMSQNERELHADFYSQWNTEADEDISKFDNDVELTTWIRELEKIALEAKVKATKGYEKLRQNKAKNRPWLVSSDTDVSVEESIKTVKTREARRSKLDKARQQMIDLGIEGADDIIKDALSRKGQSVISSTDRVIADKREPITVASTKTNTRESLVSDLSQSIRDGIETRPINDLVNATVTAAHIGNKILKLKEEKTVKIEEKDTPFNWDDFGKE